MLRTICGPENYDAIVLTTTFWDEVNKAAGNTRETQLLSDMNKWGQLVHKSPKSFVRRHDQGYKTAMSIIDLIVKRDTKHELLIQKELAKPGATLYDTTAGREAQSLWETDIKQFQEELTHAKEAFTASQQRFGATFTDEMKSLNSSINERKSALKDLLLPKQELENRWVSKNSHEVDLLQQKIIACHKTIDSLLKRASTSSFHFSSGSDTGVSQRPPGSESASASVESLLLAQEQHRQKQLMAQKMAKLTARSMQVGVASALFGGVSAGLAVLPYMCCVM
jgi:hypothetical protein